MKDDKPLKIFKTAVYVVIGAAMVFVFARNAFPVTGEAFVLEGSIEQSVPPQSSAITAPSSMMTPASSADNEEHSSIPSENSSDTVSTDHSPSSETVSSSEISSSRVPQVSSVQTADIININTASSSELQSLTGIGEVKARAIIEYREQNGGFSSVDELINVKGIGEKTLEKIRDRITV